MTKEQYMKNLTVPTGYVDVVLDTDTYNEIDDQYALAYLLASAEKLHVKAIYAAPFFNQKVHSVQEGMEKSYGEILNVLKLVGRDELSDIVYKGATEYLPDETTPVPSDAVAHLIKLAKQYSPEHPLYVLGIGAITNIASALLIDKTIAENIVVVWLGGHSWENTDEKEFNMMQDVTAARVVFSSDVPLIQLPCAGVVSAFTATEHELKYWLSGKNKLCDYLVNITCQEANSYAKGKPWSRAIWDVTAVAWLLNENQQYMKTKIVKTKLPEYDGTYSTSEIEKYIGYVYFIRRDALMEDLFTKLTM